MAPEPLGLQAPEFRLVPTQFWQRFARFLREQRTGHVTFNVGKGTVTALEAHERIGLHDDSALTKSSQAP